MNRRDFAQGAALLAASFAAWPAQAVRDDARFGAAALALVDRNVRGSAEFARAARARGLATFEFAGDPADLWMRELEPRLRSGPVAIAGHTSAATLFCLDLLARDFGARTVQRVDSDGAASFVISQHAGRRAALAPAAVRAQWRHSHA